MTALQRTGLHWTNTKAAASSGRQRQPSAALSCAAVPPTIRTESAAPTPESGLQTASHVDCGHTSERCGPACGPSRAWRATSCIAESSRREVHGCCNVQGACEGPAPDPFRLSYQLPEGACAVRVQHGFLDISGGSEDGFGLWLDGLYIVAAPAEASDTGLDILIRQVRYPQTRMHDSSIQERRRNAGTAVPCSHPHAYTSACMGVGGPHRRRHARVWAGRTAVGMHGSGWAAPGAQARPRHVPSCRLVGCRWCREHWWHVALYLHTCHPNAHSGVLQLCALTMAGVLGRRGRRNGCSGGAP